MRRRSSPTFIFVSRRRQSNLPPFESAAAIEAIAREEGLAVVYPEDFSLREQVTLFRQARLIVGEYGGALHNAIFAPRGATVVALNRIDVVQSRIARLKGHRIGFLLPKNGEAGMVDPKAPWRHGAIDPATFSSRLRESIAAAGN